MSRDEDKLIRQLSLLSYLLSQPRPFTAREIQESVEGYWGMSDETFARRFHGDRSDLAKVGIEIHSSAQGDAGDTAVYFLPEDEFHLPSIDLTPAERRSLALALATLEGRFAYARPLRLALASISLGLPGPIQDDLEEIPVALTPDEDAQQSGRQLARLEDAVSRGKSVSFAYSSATGGQETRRIDPYSLFLIQGHWYVIGLDHTRSAVRTFRVTRIVGPVRFLSEKGRDFDIPDDYDPGRYRARPPWLIGKISGTATVKIDEQLAWWVARLRPHVTLLQVDDDGCTYFSMPYADDEVLLSWVVGLDGCGELLEPVTLRERLARSLQKVIEDHDLETETSHAVATVPGENRRARPKIAKRTTGPIAPERLARAIALIQYLLDERTPSTIAWTTLEKDLGLTRSEIEADIALLNLVNFGGGTYVAFAETDDGGVRVIPDVMADLFSRPARLSPLMTRALLLALDLLGDTISIDGTRSLATVRDKVRRLAGSIPETTSVVIDDVPHLPPDLLSDLNRCIREHLVADIEYFTPTRGQVTRRRVEPYLLFRGRNGWYLEAYCLEARAQRTFRLEFVRAAALTTEVFAPRPEVDLTTRAAGGPFEATGPVGWATVRLAPRWRHYLDDRAIMYETLPDGTLRGSIAYLDESWMAGEIVRFLGDGVLEGPRSVRSRVSVLALSRLRKYRPSGLDADMREPA